MGDEGSRSDQQCASCEKLRQEVAELKQRVEELLARLNKNSSNSSRPPSSDAPWAQRYPAKKPSGRKPGGQPGHEGAFRQRLPIERVNAVVEYAPTHCLHCRAELKGAVRSGEPHFHQVAELPPLAAIVTEHQAHALRCAKCGITTRAEIPAAVLAHTVGLRFAAVLSYFSGRCRQSRRLVQEVAESVFNIPLALGSICAREKEMSAALLPAYNEIAQSVQTAPHKNVDETSWSKAGRLCWLWTATHETAALFQVHASRGKPGFNALLPQAQGVLGTDRWHAYSQIPLSRRQLCWAHLKRDFQSLVDAGGGAQRAGHAGLCVVKDVFRLWHRFRNEKFGRRTFEKSMQPIRQQLRRILEKARDGPVKKAARFSKRIIKSFDALWTFVRVPGVEPTNNHAERVLRTAVLWRKNCLGSHSDAGCRFVERMLSVVQTLRLQSRSVLQYLEAALRSHRDFSPAPSIIS